jgi:DNA end-binding protein Ku
MARSLWKGNISFGLINIPVSIASAENPQDAPEFNLLDKRDHGHIGYLKINKNTGKKVDNRYIVKGLKLESGKYSIFEQEELNKLRLKGTNSIDLQQFVDKDEIDTAYFEKPYFLLPEKGGAKTYVLLRETLKNTRKFGVGILVIHQKQHLALIGVQGKALVLELIRYSSELKSPDEYELPSDGTKSVKVSPKEVNMAEHLVEELSDPWKPEKYKDTFHDELMKALKKKSKVEVEEAPEEGESKTPTSSSKVLDLMPLLEKSIRERGHKSGSKQNKAK